MSLVHFVQDRERRKPWHWLLFFVIASCVAVGLAWCMHFLTSSAQMSLDESGRFNMLDFVRLDRDERVERKDRKPPKPEVNETPDTPPMDNSDASNSGQTLAVSAPMVDGAMGLERGGIGLGTGDGEYLPIVKVAPVYPRQALIRGIEGDCLVKYTVTGSGTVKNVEVIEDKCDDPLFYRPSREAALRFRYKPRIIDGEAVEVKGVYNRFFYRQEQ